MADNGAIVKVGSTVRVRDELGRVVDWQLVAHGESEPTHGRMSERAPLALALLNHGPGERVRVIGPERSWYVTIEAVTAA
jgi:transcription elongation GreA/GreB family factor